MLFQSRSLTTDVSDSTVLALCKYATAYETENLKRGDYFGELGVRG
jgi:hypothetical protein